MVTVGDLMSSDVVTVSPELTLRDAVELLSSQHIGAAPVVANGRVVGVFSMSDALAFDTVTPGVPAERPEQLDDELEVPADWEVEGSEPAADYFTDMWVDAGADVAERFQNPNPEWDVLQEHTVSEAMTPGVYSVTPSTSLAEAAAYLLDRKIHRALVLESGELAGILTTTDIVRAVAERRVA
ncbi:MAG TPA: CBS domain-containing protein [Gemmatimonadales bacterium]|jgi:acetoin utilization protein AcuB